MNAIVRHDESLSVSITMEAEEEKRRLLDECFLVCSVESDDEMNVAYNYQREIQTLLKQVEDSRKEIKKPIIEYGRKIETAASSFSTELKEEKLRIARLIGDYESAQEAKRKAAEAARRKELQEEERKRQEALAKAETHEERDDINNDFDAKAEAKAIERVETAAPVKKRPKVREDWVIDNIDLPSLYMSHPGLVELKPRLSEIKRVLATGATIPAVKAHIEKKTVARAA